VSRVFGRRRALGPVDVELRPGERLALVGPNGAGKSTLLALLARALPPSTGDVSVADGVRVGWAPQRPGVYGKLTARENLELFARLAGEGEPQAAAAALVEQLEVPRDVRAAELSGGNRQRLNLAVALLGSPDVLLLDEPSTGLDPAARRRLWEETLTSARAPTLAWATQSRDEAARADRVVALIDGRIAFAGPPSDLDASPAGAALT
jgi:ABC-2 type transport system ATP-binding protein